MNEMQGILGTPGVGFFELLLIGAIAGWIAAKITESSHGLFTNILVGICGSFVGSKLAEVLEISVFGFWRSLASAAIGAVILLLVWRMIHRSQTT
jgi:uncharacterized membrane protein YeaQ/YmgE (transglycosylase-associated protein family)